MFIPPKKKIQPATAAAQPTNKDSTVTHNEDKEDSKWNVLDSCCFAPYKVLFAPANMVIKAVANKVK
jgi:hypothetical protein